MAVTWHRLRVGPSDMYLSRKASFKDTLVIDVQQGKPSACAPGSCLGWSFTWCNHADCFRILHVRKIYSGVLFLFFVFMLRPSCYVYQTKTNTIFPSSIGYIYGSTWEHRWILVLLLISADCFEHGSWCSNCILNRFEFKICRPKLIFDNNIHII